MNMENLNESINYMKNITGNAFNSIVDSLNSKKQNLIDFLKGYTPGIYERPSVTVDILLFTIDNDVETDLRKLPDKELKILLIKRKDHPYIGCWAIPGGFVNIDESLDDAVCRELKEETDIDNVYFEQLYTFGDVERDPRMRIISSSYMALVNKQGLTPIAGDDADDVAFFTVKKDIVNHSQNETVYNLILENKDKGVRIGYLIVDRYMKNSIKTIDSTSIEPLYWSEDILGFDHAKIINMALDRLKNKIMYTPIAFNLVEDKFTLTELQQVYEVILGKTLIKPNFRRYIKDMVIETDKTTSTGGHRPSKLYKFNKKWKPNIL